MSAPGPFVADLESWGIRHVPLRHSTRSVSPADDLAAVPELVRLFRRPGAGHRAHPQPQARVCSGGWRPGPAGVPGIVNTVHGLYATPEDPLHPPRRRSTGSSGWPRPARGSSWSRTPTTWPPWPASGVPGRPPGAAGQRGRPGAVPAAPHRRPGHRPGPGGPGRRPLGGGGRHRRAPGVAEGVPRAVRGGGPDAHAPARGGVRGGRAERTTPRATPSPPTTWRRPRPSATSSSPATATTSRTSTPGSTCSSCPPTARASPARPWRRRPAGSRWWPPTSAAAARWWTHGVNGLLVPLHDVDALVDGRRRRWPPTRPAGGDGGAVAGQGRGRVRRPPGGHAHPRRLPPARPRPDAAVAVTRSGRRTAGGRRTTATRAATAATRAATTSSAKSSRKRRVGGVDQAGPQRLVGQQPGARRRPGLGGVGHQEVDAVLRPRPSAPSVVDTTGTRWANASRTFSRVPLPKRRGTTTTSARASSSAMSGTWPTRVTAGGSSRADRPGAWCRPAGPGRRGPVRRGGARRRRPGTGPPRRSGG